jgi:SAM-dependent methyltransferase
MLHRPPAATDVHGLHWPRLSQRERERRYSLWRVLCKDFLQRYVQATDVVVDLGAGFGEFINQIRCAKKYAVDISEETGQSVAADVIFLKQPSYRLDSIEDRCVDAVFTCNMFEHLRSKEELVETLREVRRILAPRGRLLMLQPNIRYAFREYWDYLDHHLPLSHESMTEALELAGFVVTECRPQFLPFSTRSRLPQSPFLLRIYLRLPVLQRLFGRQMFVVAVARER